MNHRLERKNKDDYRTIAQQCLDWLARVTSPREFREGTFKTQSDILGEAIDNVRKKRESKPAEPATPEPASLTPLIIVALILAAVVAVWAYGPPG